MYRQPYISIWCVNQLTAVVPRWWLFAFLFDGCLGALSFSIKQRSEYRIFPLFLSAYLLHSGACILDQLHYFLIDISNCEKQSTEVSCSLARFTSNLLVKCIAYVGSLFHTIPYETRNRSQVTRVAVTRRIRSFAPRNRHLRLRL